MKQKNPPILPLIAYCGFEPETMAARAAFYAACARAFAFEGWTLDPEPAAPPAVAPGRDGGPYEREKYGDPGIASYRDNAGDALNWLIIKGHLNSKLDGARSQEKLEQAWSDGNARRTTADELVTLFEKAELTPLRSPDLEGTPGGSFGPRHVGLSKVTSMMIVQDLRRDMPPALMKLLERILLRNDHVWHGKERRDQAKVFQDVRLALDFAHWALARHGGVAAQSKAEATLRQKWEVAGEWFRTKSLRLAVHQARVIKRRGRSRGKAGAR